MDGDQPFRRLSPLTPVVRGFIVVLAAATTIWRDLRTGDVGLLASVLGLLLVGGAAYGFASWYRTRFWIQPDELRVDTGVISRQSRRIRIDRLQGVDIVQPFVARLFGLAELRMDVAGGSAREGSLAFLRLSEARELKDQLLARRDAVREERAEPAAGGPTATPSDAAPAPERLLARVTTGTLLLSILLLPETAVMLLAVAGFLVGSVLTGQWFGVSALVPVLGGLGLVQFRCFAASYGFTVSETPAGIQVRRGLFDLNTQTITLARLQGVVLTEPVLWRSLGWARLDVSIAGYATGADESGQSTSTALPVGDRALAMRLARTLLRGVDPDRVALTPPPRSARWVAPVASRFMAVGASPEVVVAREGWLARRTHVTPQGKIQSLRIVQGPYQRLLGLADMHVDSPPGPARVTARHRAAAQVREAFEIEVRVSREARQALDASSR